MFTKKGHFKKQIKRATEALWTLEFRLFEAREMREERRRQRDRSQEDLNVLDNRLPQDMPQEEKDSLLAKRKEMQEYHEYITDQLKALDIEIEGLKPSEKDPQGYQGILDQIDALRGRIEMYKDYIKRNL